MREEIAYAVMLVSSGSFYFVSSFDAGLLPYRLNLSVTSLLMEGVRPLPFTCRHRLPLDLCLLLPVRVLHRDGTLGEARHLPRSVSTFCMYLRAPGTADRSTRRKLTA